MIEAVKCQIENEMHALCIACVSNSCRLVFGIVAKLSNVGRGFILRC